MPVVVSVVLAAAVVVAVAVAVAQMHVACQLSKMAVMAGVE